MFRVYILTTENLFEEEVVLGTWQGKPSLAQIKKLLKETSLYERMEDYKAATHLDRFGTYNEFSLRDYYVQEKGEG